jgi:hypothetical protein
VGGVIALTVFETMRDLHPSRLAMRVLIVQGCWREKNQ